MLQLMHLKPILIDRRNYINKILKMRSSGSKTFTAQIGGGRKEGTKHRETASFLSTLLSVVLATCITCAAELLPQNSQMISVSEGPKCRALQKSLLLGLPLTPSSLPGNYELPRALCDPSMGERKGPCPLFRAQRACLVPRMLPPAEMV